METLYFLAIALGGGLLAIFLSAGWSSFKHKKIPEKGIMFRWFVAGLVTAGLCAYAWIFGSGGDVGEMVSRIGGALDIENVMKVAATAATAATAAATAGGLGLVGSADVVEEPKKDEMHVGMPRF